MALDPNIILQGARGPDVMGSVQQGLQAAGIFQQLQQQQAEAPLRNQLLQQQVAEGDRLSQARQDTAKLAEQNRVLGSIANSYSGVKDLVDAGRFSEAADRLEANKEVLRRSGITNFEDSDYAIEAFRSGDPERIRKAQLLGDASIREATSRGIISGPEKPKSGRFKETRQGFVLDSATGEVKAPSIGVNLIGKEKLETKDIQSINKDITSLAKSAKEIRQGAVDLDSLKERGTASSKLAAVFKFMKALDPTSVVRETEQGQVYAAQGAASSLAGRINSLLGKGQLTEEGFQDLVDTSKVLANSAVSSASKEVNEFLDTFDFDEAQRAKFEARIPEELKMQQERKQLDQLSDDDLLRF